MKLGKKLLAFLVTFLMLFSNVLVGIPVASAVGLSSLGTWDWAAVNSFGQSGLYFAKHDSGSLSHTVSGGETFYKQFSPSRTYDAMGRPAVTCVIIKSSTDWYEYVRSGSGWVLDGKSLGADSQYTVNVTYSGGYPTITAAKVSGHDVSHMLFGVDYHEGNFKIKKVFDGTADNSKNFTIHINGDNGVSRTITINAGQGWVEVKDLPYSTYTITEDSASLFQTVSISGSETGNNTVIINSEGFTNGTVTVTNRLVGSAKLRKVVDNVTDDGTPFTLNITSPNGYSNSVTVNETGSWVMLDNLPLGTYTVTEAAANGYATVGISPASFTITKDNRSATVAVTATNRKLYGSVKLAKVVNNVSGDGASFKLNVTGDTGYAGSVTLNETSGWQTLSGLPFGHYTVTEDDKTGYRTVSITPAEFDINDSTYTAAIEVTAVNEKLFGSVSLQKVVDNAAADTMDFTINISGNGINQDITLNQNDGVVDKNDYAILGSLPFGTYTVTETGVASGYDKIKLEINGVEADTFTVDASTCETTIAVVATNRKRLGSVSLRKTVDNVSNDATSFTINISGNGINQDITLSESGGVIDSSDLAILAQLPYGTYTVTETGTVTGYEKIGITVNGVEATTFTIDDTSYSSTIAIVATNHKRFGSVQLQKEVDNVTGDTTDFTINISGNGINQDISLNESDGVVNSSDLAILAQLPYGSYTVSETGVASGYEKVKIEINGVATDSFTINDSTYATTISIVATNHKRFGRVNVQKIIDNATGVDTTDFTVNISSPNGFNHDITISQDDGIIDASDYAFLGELPYGIYTVTETGVATGYSKVRIEIDSTETDTFTIDDTTYDAAIGIVVTNTIRHCAVQLQKLVDNATADSTNFTVHISGPNFEHDIVLSQDDGVLDSSDYAFLGELAYGVYTVSETGVGSGYEKVNLLINGTVSDTFTIDDSNHESTVSIVATNHKRLGSVSLQKLVDNVADDATDFTINISGNGIDQDITLSEHNGVIDSSDYAVLAQLPYGTYTISETGVATGYEKVGITVNGMAATTFIIDDTTYSSMIAIAATNHKRFGSVQLQKVVDNTDGDMTSFTINILGDNGYNRDVTLSQNDGLVDSSDLSFLGELPYGAYTVSEKNIDNEYEPVKIEINGTPASTFTIGDRTYASTISIVATNHKRFGHAVFSKAVDNVESDPATFTLNVYKDGEIIPYTIVTVNETGATIDRELPFGHYTVEEVANPLYETVSINVNEFTVDAESYMTTVYVTAVNHKKLGWVSFAKIVDNIDNDPAVFTLQVTGDNGYSNTVQVGELLVGCSLWNLPLGHYTVTELPAANYTNINIIPAEFDINDANWATTSEIDPSVSVVATNHKQLSRIQVIKKDSADPSLYLAGAMFKISTSNIDFETNVKGTMTTDATGSATSGYLEAGDYWVKEITAPGGYVIDNPAAIMVTLPYNTTLVMEPFTDTKDEGSLLIRKVSTLDRKPVAGVQFQVSATATFDPGTLLPLPNDGRTDANGELLVQHLPTGLVLWVREIQQAPGYDIDPTVVRNVTVIFNGSVTADFANSPVGRVRVTKVDAADAAVKLAGAVFGVYSDAQCTVLLETLAATDADGIATSGELPFGANTVYYVKEITAPAGYLLNTAVQQASFTEPGQIRELTFTNTKTTGSLVILKVDALDETKKLAGAVFQLYADEAMLTKVGAEVTTGADGLATWTGLEAGAYWIFETAAPEDYDLLGVALPVTVTAGVTQPDPIVIKDQYNPPEDIQTGMMDWNILLLGAFALLSGLLLVVLGRKKAKHNR